MEIPRTSIRIDLNDFKLHLHFPKSTQLTLHFNSPSRKFYLSVIALVVQEMKRSGKIKPISLREHLDLLALLNESIGGAAGSSEKENLLPRIYIKWKNALPNLEEAPLFKVLGKKKEAGDRSNGKIYLFTDSEKDGWANLFDYIGSDENVRLKFAVDKIGLRLNETSIIFKDSVNGDAWDQFISSLKRDGKDESAGAIWKIYPRPAPIEVASVNRMKYPLPDRPSIAVLPFVNMSKDPDQEYFSDGITEDLITDLSKISGLMVIARNSTFPYKGKPVNIRQVAEELGVRYILEGSIQKAGKEIRINAQLVDAITGVHLWAERYDGSMKDVFALQDRITQKIVLALAVRLTGAEKQTIAEKGTNNLEAYDEFLRGWRYYLPEKPDELANAVKSFKKAIELDPNYGRAHAALAYLHFQGTWVLGLYEGLEASGLTWIEARLRMGQYLKQGMNNPTPLAHQVNGLLYLFRRQHEEAVSELERALALDPNDPSSNFHMAHVLNFSGKPKEAVDFTKRAMRLDPHNPGPYSNILGIAHFCMGNLEEAAAWLEKGFRLHPEVLGGTPWLASIYGSLGREKEARLALDNLKKAWRRELSLSNLMYALPFKDRAVADRFIEGILKAGLKGMPSEYFPAYNENRMTGEEIKRLLFGAKTSGFLPDGQQWWVDYNKEGEAAWRGEGPIPSDTGKSRIDGDMICTKFQKNYWGIEYCSTVFRNFGGTYEGKNEYVFCTAWGFSPFSVER